MANFTLQDITGSAIAVAGFAIVLCAPGYVLAHVVDLFGFRGKSFTERMLWGIACSFGVVPIFVYLAGKYVGIGAVCWAAIAIVVLFLWLIIKEWLSGKFFPQWPQGERVLTGVLLGAWGVFVVLSLVDVQIGNKLYFSVVLFDQSYRVAFTDAVMRTGVPPANPLYFAGHPQPLRYYYFWYVICAVVERIAHVSARQAFIASSVWAGFGLAAMIALYTRHFFGVIRGVHRQTWLTVALLAVTGADLLPAIGSLFAQKALNGEMEWWSIDQFYSWQDTLLWVPHHTASLLCCLLSFLLLWRTREPLGRNQRILAAGLAGVAFASAFGLSIYVAFGFALLMLAWMARLLLAKLRDARLCGRIAGAGALSFVLLAPFLRELLAKSAGPAPGPSAAHVFALSVRRMIDPELLTGLPVFAAWNKAHPVLLDQGMRLLLLLPGLALELGFYGAVLVLVIMAWRRNRVRLDEPHRTALYLTICGLVMVLFIRSSVISNNDFGYRAALLPQFFLLLLGASLLAGWWMPGREAVVAATPMRRRIVYGLLALGVAGTLYQAVMLRLFLPIEQAHPANGFAYLPAAAFQARRAFAELDRVAPQSAVVEFNPVDPTNDSMGDVVTPFTFFERVLLMDSDHQILNAEPTCATEFGGDAQSCQAIRDATAMLYALPAPSAQWAVEYCRRFGVDDLVASRLDPAWSDAAGWVAKLPAIAAEPGVRILSCRSQSQ